MKKLLKYFVLASVVFLLVLVVAWFARGLYLEPLIKNNVEKNLTEALNAPTKIKSLKFESLLPFKLTIKGFQSSPENISIQVSEVSLSLSLSEVLTGLPSVRISPSIFIKEPIVQIKRVDMQSAQSKKAGGSGGDSFEAPKEIEANINLHIEKGMLTYIHARPEKKDLTLQIPFAINPSQIQLKENKLTAKGLLLSVAHMQMTLNGQTVLAPLNHKWNAVLQIPDIGQLPIPPEFLPPGNWQGSINGKFVFTQKNSQKPFVSGSVQTKNLMGNVNWKHEQFQVAGPVRAVLNTQFSYFDKINVPKLNLKVQLKGADIFIPQYLNKKKDIPLELQVEALTKDNKLQIKQAFLQFFKLKAKSWGEVDLTPGKPSNIRFKVSPTDLKGFEKLIPMMGNYPASGQVELLGRVQGDLQNIDTLDILVNPLKLKNVSMNLDLKDKKNNIYISGPFRANAVVEVEAQGKNLKKAFFDVNSQLGQMSFNFKNQFYKKKNQKLSLVLMGQQKGEQIIISKGQFFTHAGQFRLSGTVKEPLNPILNIKVILSQLNLKNATEMLPMLKPYKLSGVISGEAEVKGKFDLKQGIEKSPLTVNANFKGNLNRAVFISEKKQQVAKGQSAAEAPAAKPTPILPNWPLFKKSKIDAYINLKQFQFNDLKIVGISARSHFYKGEISGATKIAKLFDGQVDVKNFKGNLLKVNTPFSAQGEVKGLNLQPSVNWLLPDWKDQVKGRASTKFKVTLPFSPTDKVLTEVQAQGNLQVQNAFLSSVQFDKLANEKIAKIPGVGKKTKLNSKGALLNIKAESYKLRNGVVAFKGLNLANPQGDQFAANGTLDLNKNLNLKGILYLKSAAVRGDVYEANKDSQGRFVVPVEVKGNLLDPKLSFADATLKKLAQKTLEYNKNKEIKKLQKKGEKALQKELKKSADKLRKSLGI